MKVLSLLSSGIVLFFLAATPTKAQKSNTSTKHMNSEHLAKATFGEGCFWCAEAVFEEVKGVKSVVAGYAGGHVKNPTYEQVSSGTTGHAEVARITYDPSVVSYRELLEVFWHTHNPTTLNRQGADVGTQYRSVIFYHNEKQKETAEESLKKTEKSGLWDDPIVTKIVPLKNYSKAENYHQNYYKNHPNAGYCSIVIAPKLKKFRKEFAYLLKDEVKSSE